MDDQPNVSHAERAHYRAIVLVREIDALLARVDELRLERDVCWAEAQAGGYSYHQIEIANGMSHQTVTAGIKRGRTHLHRQAS